ncbi:hypothetical protein M2399_004354 [Pseudomonas sp. BIGb0450]|uniref:NEL-type E3 ubiquitin ligase domain-containing protein n=1 Tax=unclassified Pseudomonas TaxID=196821 RepID=UPI00216920E6|nr:MULTISPECIES: NEL-type E3 ubiquitin ligase domain-containing protein [unclassified Pseudomonas]MCS3419317.1 hypothetical protein [Pseudomonas sp. BIGb0558]MCS3438899.1 hypothetical protein [Pseudomonas sp. BIGb0450]
MSDLPGADFQGTHYLLIKNTLPPWIKGAAPDRARALKTARPLNVAPTPALKTAIAEHWQNQSAVDQKFRDLNDVQAFAEPLLKSALAHYGEIDVRNTFLRLYSKAELAWWVHDSSNAVVSRTVSLLDAALHNFAASDSFVDYAFLSAEDARGQRDVLNLRHRTSGASLTADTFKTLCRQLNIGARYQARLQEALGFNNAALARTVREATICSQKSALTVAAHLALILGHVRPDAHLATLKLVAGQSNAHLDGRPLGAYTVHLMNSALSGIVLFCATPGTETPVGRVIVYVPEDPEHPLKEYPSPIAFVQELTRQLRDSTRYQRFFSQFVAQGERGHFFANLNARLSKVRWHQKAPTDPGPTWKDTPVNNPNLQFRLQHIADDYQNRSGNPGENDLWHYRFRITLNKLLNDAREIAVSTAVADRHARWAWWDNLEKILSDILNAALLVATPFVPLLGELMLVYSAYQIADEVFTGIVDWAEGQRLEAFEHLMDVVDSVLQFAAFGAASTLGQAARLKLSPFVEGLKPVTTADGRTRLWHPDLTPYALKNIALAADTKPDARGLYSHQDQLILPLNNQHVEVRQTDDNGQHRIRHPERPDAYHPKVSFNGHGAFVHEAEQPRRWDSNLLMRRLGPRTQAFSDLELQQVRRISATDEDQLRGLYVYNRPPPPLLEATLKRHEAYHTAKTAAGTLRTGTPMPDDPTSAWFEQTVTELPGWPENTALQVFARADLAGGSRTYTKPGATPSATLKVSLGQVMSGQLPERVLGFLDEEAIRTLLGRDVPRAERVQALRDQLADYVQTQTDDIGKYVHQINQQSADPQVRLLQRQLPGLDPTLARTVLDTATRTERQTLSEQHVPLRLLNQAEELHFVQHANQAYAGLYPSWPLTPDTERMVLNTLKLHSDAFADLHLEVREQTPDGPLRCEAGPADASQQRILVRKNNHGYELFDQAHQRLHTLDTLYESLLHAVTVPGQKPGQGAELKRWLMDKLHTLDERRRVLAQPPIRTTADTQTSRLLRGPVASRQAGTPQPASTPHTREVLQLLFPSLSEQRVEQFIDNVDARQMRSVLNLLTTEKQQLYHRLEVWKRTATAHPKDSRAFRQERAARHLLADKLYRCWEDRMAVHTDPWGNVQGGAELDLRGLLLPDMLPELTTGFEHVTSLTIADNRFGVLHEHFLKGFPSLRALDLGYNDLSRMPEAIGEMRFLRYLNLRDNRIMLPPAQRQFLSRLRRLEHLQLQNNPLGIPPDISRMPNLRDLLLSRTQITLWPTGLFSHPRNRSFLLDLRGNAIEQVPEFARGTPQAETVARTRLDRNTLDLEHRQRYESYRVAAGLDPNRTYEPKGDSTYWLEAMDPQLHEHRKTLWNALEQEHGSQGLFEVLKSLEREESVQTEEDRERIAINRPELTQRVWQLILAASVDSDLRDTLFKMSSFPGLCADGGAQIFNDMGIEVLATEARRYSLTDEERTGKLVTLAKGRAHMRHLGEVIQEDIAWRLRPVTEGGLGQRLRSDMRDGEPGEVDEVEIYLAYQTSLAQKLDLPWLSDHMLYRLTADVPQARIDEAYQTVLEMAEGDGLVNQMLLEPYWEQYLRDRYDAEYRDNEQRCTEQFLKLDDLQDTQHQWTRAQDPAQKELLSQSLKPLAEALGVPERVVFSRQPMSDDLYNRLLNDLGYKEKEWMRRLTREALARATGLSNREAVASTRL